MAWEGWLGLLERCGMLGKKVSKEEGEGAVGLDKTGAEDLVDFDCDKRYKDPACRMLCRNFLLTAAAVRSAGAASGMKVEKGKAADQGSSVVEKGKAADQGESENCLVENSDHSSSTSTSNEVASSGESSPIHPTDHPMIDCFTQSILSATTIFDDPYHTCQYPSPPEEHFGGEFGQYFEEELEVELDQLATSLMFALDPENYLSMEEQTGLQAVFEVGESSHQATNEQTMQEPCSVWPFDNGPTRNLFQNSSLAPSVNIKVEPLSPPLQDMNPNGLDGFQPVSNYEMDLPNTEGLEAVLEYPPLQVLDYPMFHTLGMDVVADHHLMDHEVHFSERPLPSFGPLDDPCDVLLDLELQDADFVSGFLNKEEQVALMRNELGTMNGGSNELNACSDNESVGSTRHDGQRS